MSNGKLVKANLPFGKNKKTERTIANPPTLQQMPYKPRNPTKK